MEDPTNDGTSGAVVNQIAEAGAAAEEAVSMDTASRHENNMVEVNKLAAGATSGEVAERIAYAFVAEQRR